MNPTNPDSPQSAVHPALEDDSLVRLRKAYHELEAYQLSDQHRASKEALRQRLFEQGELS